jgi:hypothetical protein
MGVVSISLIYPPGLEIGLPENAQGEIVGLCILDVVRLEI